MILIDSWPYDLLVSGDLVLDSEITDDPMESGGATADHINNLPAELTTECIVSDTPIGEVAAHESRRVDDVSIAVFGSNMVPLPSEEAYERLTAIRDEKRTVTIEIPLMGRNGRPAKRILRNMAIAGLTLPMNKDTAGGLFFTATWKELRFTTNARSTVRVATPQAKPQASHKATVGEFVRVDQTVLWNMASPPGGVLIPYISPERPGSPWAVIDVMWSDGKGGPGAKARFFYSGTSSASKPTQAGKELSPAETSAFNADLKRDTEVKKNRQYEQLKKDLVPVDKAGGHKNLPAGLDLSRFSAPTQKTVP